MKLSGPRELQQLPSSLSHQAMSTFLRRQFISNFVKLLPAVEGVGKCNYHSIRSFSPASVGTINNSSSSSLGSSDHDRCSRYVVFRTMAGHSKWQNIKHTKEAKDSQRSLLFTKLSQSIKLAVTQGGNADPKINSQLATAIAQAKKANMPMSKIENQIKQITESKNEFKSAIIEIKGPRGCFILLEIYSDKITKFDQELRHLIKKVPGFGVADNAAKGMFNYKGIIVTETNSPDGQPISIDKATEDAILAGAEEVQEIDGEETNFYEFSCNIYELANVNKNLEEMGSYVISSADREYVPVSYVTLNDDEMKAMKKLHTKLDDFQEVVNIYSNVSTDV